MITTVSSSAALSAALLTAQSGDTIQLTSGVYGKLTISDLKVGGVTITAEPGAGASITGLSITNSSGLVFLGIGLIADPSGGANPLSVVGSQDIYFDYVQVYGSLDQNPGNDVGGLLIRSSSNVSVTNSQFQQLFWGVTHLDSNNLTISGNQFHDLRMDGVRGGGSSGVTISGNSFIDFYPAVGDHADAIQFWTSGTTRAGTDIVITDNVYIRGAGAMAQGIFMRDEVGGLPYQRVTISGNLISGGLYHGIAIGSGIDVTVKDNVVQGFSDNRSWINLDNIQGGQVTNNATSELSISSNVSNLLQAGNTILPLATDAGAAVSALWTASRGLPVPSSSYASHGANTNSQSIQGDDTSNKLAGGTGNDTVTGLLGDDTITDAGGSNYLRGDDGNDQITGGSGFDDINGNAGADSIRGGSGNDWVVGGKDNDRLFGEGGDDLVYGNLGDDLVEGGDGTDVVRGGQGNDVLKGEGGSDYVSGDKGDDTMSGGSGADTFHSFGDAGIDRITDFNRSQGDNVLLDLGTTYSVAQTGADTVISMGGGGQVILVGVSLSSLTGNWLTVG